MQKFSLPPPPPPPPPHTQEKENCIMHIDGYYFSRCLISEVFQRSYEGMLNFQIFQRSHEWKDA